MNDKSGKWIKGVGFLALAVGFIADRILESVNEKKQEVLIEKKVQEAIAANNNEKES